MGFADRTLGLRHFEKTRKAGNEIRSRLQKLGLGASGHEHFNGSIVIAVIGPSGDIIKSLRPQDHRGAAAPAPPITCTCPGPIGACVTRPGSPATRKSFSARH